VIPVHRRSSSVSDGGLGSFGGLVGDRMDTENEKPPRHWGWDDHPYLVTVAFLMACVVIGLRLFFYMAGD
jgi:hypothetical protein